MSTLREYFERRTHPLSESILTYAETKKPQGHPYWQKMQRGELEEKLETLLLNGAMAHHTCLYALYGLGYNSRQIARKIRFKHRKVSDGLTEARRILGESRQLRRGLAIGTM